MQVLAAPTSSVEIPHLYIRIIVLYFYLKALWLIELPTATQDMILLFPFCR